MTRRIWSFDSRKATPLRGAITVVIAGIARTENRTSVSLRTFCSPRNVVPSRSQRLRGAKAPRALVSYATFGKILRLSKQAGGQMETAMKPIDTDATHILTK